MSVFLWLFQYISPITFILGAIYLLGDPSPVAIVLGVIAAILGLVVGIIGWADTVPPRWFWIKSSMDLAGSRVLTALGYAVQFFFLPAAIIGLLEYFG